MAKSRKTPAAPAEPKPYQHPDADSPARPEIGAQAHFKGGKGPAVYRYDSSLAPELRWDGQNGAREQGEALIAEILEELRAARESTAPADAAAGRQRPASPPAGLSPAEAATQEALARAEGKLRMLQSLSRPFLNWAGKEERLSAPHAESSSLELAA